MLWLMLLAGGAGLLLVTWMLRVHFIALVSVALVLVSIGVALTAQWGVVLIVAFIFGMLRALQGGYLVGLFASWAWMRARDPQAILRSNHIDQCRT